MDSSGAGDRVLLLAQPTSGGVARHVFDLATGLAVRGWDVVVGCPDTPWLAPSLADAGVLVHPVSFVRRIDPGGDLRTLGAIRHLLDELDPALVHAHSSKAGFLGRLAARRRRGGTPRTGRGAIPVLYTPHCFAFVGSGLGPRGRLYRWAERVAGPWTTMLIAVADDEAEQAVASRLVDRSRVRRVHNGLAPRKESAAPEAPAVRPDAAGEDETVTFVTVGRADRQKAFDVFVEAALAARDGAPNARFVLVGGDYTRAGTLERLRELVRTSGAEQDVSFVGEHPDPEALLADGDVLVLPSRWEAFPYVLLEAGRHALPVIATPVGGVPEIVEQDSTGLLVQVDDVGGLAAAMVRLAGDPEARRRMGLSMKERTAAFTADRMVDETAAIYREVLGTTGRRLGS